RQLDDGLLVLRPVADKGVGELTAGIVVPPQQCHAENFGIEGNRLVEVENPDHGVHVAEAACGVAHWESPPDSAICGSDHPHQTVDGGTAPLDVLNQGCMITLQVWRLSSRFKR